MFEIHRLQFNVYMKLIKYKLGSGQLGYTKCRMVRQIQMVGFEASLIELIRRGTHTNSAAYPPLSSQSLASRKLFV
jgi:hypothetical protein